MEPPDEEYFIKQARQYGFDENDYLAAMRKVPIITEEKLLRNLTFIRNLTQMLAEQGLQRKRQNQITEALRKSEQHSLAIIEALPVPLAMNDEHGNVTFLNKAFIQTIGYTVNDISTLSDWWPRAYPDPHYREWVIGAWQKNMEEARRTHRPFAPMEANITCKDDSVRTFICGATDLIDNSAGTHLVFLYDITERKQAENALRESEDRFRVLFEGAPDAIILADPENGEIVDANRAACRLLGREHKEIVRIRQDELHPPQSGEYSKETFQRHVRESREGGVTSPIEHVVLRSDGAEVPVEVLAQMINLNDRMVIMGIFRDITERKQAENELQKKNTDIEQFLYTVSHDLRSPLVTVKTFLGYLVSDMAGNDPERINQDLQFIHGAADKMKLLLDELLEMSRIDRVETQPVSVSIREVMVEVMETLAGNINERRADVLLPDNDLMLIVDRPRFCRIWQNLIENAIKYSRDDITSRIELGVQELNGQSVFFVKDNGIGIAPEYCTKIFGIFEKLDPKSPGAGLGLSMIQRIVEKSGGRVWVESEGKDKGSCFFFTLPSVVVQS
jgi:PAS domain S-box-containing protein